MRGVLPDVDGLGPFSSAEGVVSPLDACRVVLVGRRSEWASAGRSLGVPAGIGDTEPPQPSYERSAIVKCICEVGLRAPAIVCSAWMRGYSSLNECLKRCARGADTCV